MGSRRRACARPGCSGTTTIGSLCEGCFGAARARALGEARASAAERGYDGTWRRRRAAFLRKNPFCADCGLAANEAHHVVKKAEGGSDSAKNLMALCKACHSKRTAVGE